VFVFRFLSLTFLFLFFYGVGWALPLQNEANIQLTSVEAKYDAQRRVLVLHGKLSIPSPWHVYAHELEQEYYIETGFRLQDPNMGELVRSQFPKEETLRVVGEELKVHSGNLSFSQWFYLNAQEDDILFPLEVRLQYQACSDTICLPPVLLPVSLREIEGASGKSLQVEW
jgi:hypothetical protein